jgi:hypothetical protein
MNAAACDAVITLNDHHLEAVDLARRQAVERLGGAGWIASPASAGMV